MKKENRYFIYMTIAMVILSIISFLVMAMTSAEPIQNETEDTDIDTMSGIESIQVCPPCNNNFREIIREDVNYNTDGKYDNWERIVLPAKGDREYWEIQIGDDTWDKEELDLIKLERVK